VRHLVSNKLIWFSFHSAVGVSCDLSDPWILRARAVLGGGFSWFLHGCLFCTCRAETPWLSHQRICSNSVDFRVKLVLPFEDYYVVYLVCVSRLQNCLIS
jgi:hypothetical protein